MMRLATTTRRAFLAQAGAALLGMAPGRLRGEESVIDRLRREADGAALAMRFSGSSAEDCRRWQADFGAKLRELLGPIVPPKVWKTRLVRADDLADCRREELVLEAEGHPPLPVYLLLPRPKTARRRAGVVALHGHGRHGNHPVAGRDDLPGVADAIKSTHYDYGRQLALRGYAVAAPCLTPFGIRLGNPDAFGKQDPCADTFLRMQILGKLLIAENMRDSLWALELLARHAEVDADRLGCVGLSYGGRMTMLTAAVEPRIKAAVVSGALNLMQERVRNPYSCGAQIIPGLLRYGDTPEIASLIAPRTCLWEVGSRDGLLDPKLAADALGRIGRAYRALGAEDRLHVDHFEGGHVWNGEAAYPLLNRILG
jgi:dienelactone hydrolase